MEGFEGSIMSMDEQTATNRSATLTGAWPDAPKPESDKQKRLKEELAGRLSMNTEDLIVETFKDAKRDGCPWREAVDRACEAAALKVHRDPKDIRDKVVRVIEAYSTRL